MKITLSAQEVQTAKDFAEKRRLDSLNKGLKHSRNLKSLSNDLDDCSVMAEIAAAKILGVEPILECGRYGQPDLYFHGLPIDVKFSYCKPSFAVPPSLFQKLPGNAAIFYVTGQKPPQNANSVEFDLIGGISMNRCSGSMPLDDFGNPSRPPAYKVRVTDLKPIHEIINHFSKV